jgi:signal peptidase II
MTGPARRLLLAAGTPLAVLAADMPTKQLAEQHLATPLDLPLGAQLALGHNSGIAFGALADAPTGVVIAIAAAGIAAIAAAVLRGWLDANGVVIGLLAGGAAANMLDRAGDGHVTDFIALPHWPTFNVADIAITFAALALVAGFGGRRAPSTRRASAA